MAADLRGGGVLSADEERENRELQDQWTNGGDSEDEIPKKATTRTTARASCSRFWMRRNLLSALMPLT